MNELLVVDQIVVEGKKVLVRVDFNVPFDKEGNISDDTRIKEALPTLLDILRRKGAIVLMSHLGRPKQREKELSLEKLLPLLQKYLSPYPVFFFPECRGDALKKRVESLKSSEVLLIENLRFEKGEESPEKDPFFAKELSLLGDVYIDDAFGAAHREHASIVGIPSFLKEKGIGFLMKKEIESLEKITNSPKRPFVAALGGAKISTKLGVIKALLDKVDTLLIGGGMAYTFLKAEGVQIGHSLCEDSFIEEAKLILKKAKELHKQIILPLDFIITEDPNNETKEIRVVTREEGIPPSFEGVDIGPKTSTLFAEIAAKSQTLFWNGPFGIFEKEPFSKGTFNFAKVVASLKGETIVGGGDSVLALEKAKVKEKISHVSTGGGASLEFIEGGTLPGIEILKKGVFA